MNIELMTSSDLVRGIRSFAFGSADAGEVHEKLQTIPGVDADLITQGAEILYAHIDELDDDGLALCAAIFLHMNEQGFTTCCGGPKGSNNRAEKIIELVRSGKDKAGLDALKWPEPKAEIRAGIDWRLPTPEEDEAVEEQAEPDKKKPGLPTR